MLQETTVAATPVIVHAGDDPESGPENSAAMYLALRRAKIPSELHIYARGGHGFGVRKTGQPCSTWTDRCVAWLRIQGLLPSPTRPAATP